MLPVSPTHALAIARAADVQRRAERAYLSSTEPDAATRLMSALRTVSRHVRRPVSAPARAASARPTAVCCA